MEFARFASRLLASPYSLCPSSVISSFSQSLIKVQLQVKLKHDNVAVRKKERASENERAKRGADGFVAALRLSRALPISFSSSFSVGRT